MITKRERRLKIRRRVRRHISGTAQRPRLCVFRSNKQIYAQVIDDVEGRTIVASDSRNITEAMPKKDMAARVGQDIAKKAQAVGVETVVFDRSGYLYHGRVRELAEAARRAGLKF